MEQFYLMERRANNET